MGKQPVELMPGDHIKVRRVGYDHHGIYSDTNSVLNYTGEPLQKSNASVKETSLEEFCNGGQLQVVRYLGKTYPPDQVIARARSLLGAKKYDLVFNNCENFASFCKTGSSVSAQVLRAGVISGLCVAANIRHGVIGVTISLLAGPIVMGLYTGVFKMDLDIFRTSYPARLPGRER